MILRAARQLEPHHTSVYLNKSRLARASARVAHSSLGSSAEKCIAHSERRPNSRLPGDRVGPRRLRRVSHGASTLQVKQIPEAGGTTVQIVHSGLPEIEAPEHAAGWTHFLARLALAAAELSTLPTAAGAGTVLVAECNTVHYGRWLPTKTRRD